MIPLTENPPLSAAPENTPVRWARVVATSFAWLTADRFVRMAVSMVVGLLVARHLGPDRFGLFNYTLALVSMLQPLAELGLDAIGRREFAARPHAAGAIARTIMSIRLLGAGAACLICVIFTLLGSSAPQEQRLILILALVLFQPWAMLPEAWLQVNRRAGHAVRRQWLALAGGTCGRLAAIYVDAPLEVFAAIVVTEAALAAVLINVAARRQGLASQVFDRALARNLLRQAWPLAVASVAIAIHMRIDVVLLRWLLGDTITGTYSAAVRLSELPYFIPAMAALSVQPLLAQAATGSRERYRKLLQIYLDGSAVCAYLGALFLSLLAPWIIATAYGHQYQDAAQILAIHAWAAVFVFQGVARSLFLVNAGHTRFELLASVLGAVLNVTLNAILIPRFQGAGAAIATVAAQAASTWLVGFLHPACRSFAWQQTRALFWPGTGIRYLITWRRYPHPTPPSGPSADPHE